MANSANGGRGLGFPGLRLLYVTSSFPFGGGEAFLLPEALELRDRGHTVRVVPVFPRGDVVHSDVEPVLAETVRESLLSPSIVAAAGYELAHNPAAALAALRLLADSRNARILGKNLLVAAKGLWLARLARSFRADHIHAHWGATSATIAMIASRAAGVPWSMTVHRWDIRENNLLQEKLHAASFVRAISESGLRALLAAAPAPPARPPVVIHMGVPLPPLPARTAPEPDRPFRILVAAGLLEVKGHEHLIEAVAALEARGREVVAELAGEGPLQGRLERLAAARGVSAACRFLGQVGHAELIGRLARGDWDLVALTSVETPCGETEGIPVALLEAMSYGVPVLASSVGGIPELLRGGAGVLVPPADPAALADAIEHLLDHRDELVGLGAAGRRRVEEEFSIGAVVDALEARIRQASA